MEAISESAERWAKGCAVIVVIGVIAEVALIIWQFPYDSVCERVGMGSADILIALGIAGEVLFASRESKCQKELTRRANNELAKAKFETEKLREIYAPRMVSAEHHKNIADRLKEYAGKRIEVISYAGDLESGHLASQIIVALRDAEIVAVNRIAAFVGLGTLKQGIVVDSADDDFRLEIQRALISGGNFIVYFENVDMSGPGLSSSPEDPTPVDGTIFVGFRKLDPGYHMAR